MKQSSSNLIKYCLVFAFFLLPLTQWSSVFSPFEIPKAWFVILTTEVLTLLTIFCYRQLPREYHKYIWLPLWLLFALTISSIANNTLLTSLIGNSSRFDGLFTLAHLITFSTITGLIWNRSWDLITAKSIALGSISISLWNILGTIFPLLTPESARWQGAVATGFGNPNILAGYMVTTLPFTIWLIKSTNNSKKIWWIFGLILELLTIGMTKSWGGLLGVLISFSIFFVNKWDWKNIFLTMFLIVSVVGLYFYDYESKLIPLEFVAESRQRIIMKSLIAFTEKPLLGWGWTQFSVAFQKIDWPEHFDSEVYVDRTHSSILEVAVSGGLISTTIYLVMIITSILKLMRNNNSYTRIVGMSLIVYLIHSQTNVTSVAEELLMWFAVGIGNNISQPKA